VCHLHIEEGWDESSLSVMLKLELVIRGAKRVQGNSGQSKQRLPITLILLGKLRTVWLAGGRDELMLWQHLLCVFFCFLMSGEITCPRTRPSTERYTYRSSTDVAVDSLVTTSMLKGVQYRSIWQGNQCGGRKDSE